VRELKNNKTEEKEKEKGENCKFFSENELAQLYIK